jgi:tetraacyldisaccharide 4'-kinase
VIATLYAAVARRRREWYAARPNARQRLRRPVISIGNIAVGGRGKTPLTASVARALLEMGERPAILSRGYARTARERAPVVVRDAQGIRADLARSGDEPLMLARQLPGAIVVSGPDRFAGGQLAESTLGATVHVLDDGFQHFALDRDVDIVLVAARDLQDSTLPSGRLREPPDVLIAADAIVALDRFDPPVEHAASFSARRRTAAATFESGGPARPNRVLALAAIADPDAFFADVVEQGFEVVAMRRFRDHHPFSASDVERLMREARAAGAAGLVTTEKDYVRLLPFRPFRLPIGYLPLTMDVEPPDEFRRWLLESMAAARDIILG